MPESSPRPAPPLALAAGACVLSCLGAGSLTLMLCTPPWWVHALTLVVSGVGLWNATAAIGRSRDALPRGVGRLLRGVLLTAGLLAGVGLVGAALGGAHGPEPGLQARCGEAR